MSAMINAVDRVFSYERNTIRRDIVRLAGAIRQLNPAAGFVLFALGWIVGLTGSLVGLTIVAALVAGILLARAATIPAPQIVNVPPAIEPATVQGVSLASPIQELLASAGLHVKKIEIAPQPVNGKAKVKA